MRILMTMFGWKDSGGGTILPRHIALALQSRGHEVWVFYAATEYLPDAPPYTLSWTEEQGVQWIGVHNWGLRLRDLMTGYLGGGQPEEEIENPEIRIRFQEIINKFKPDIVHFHNFYALSMSFSDIPRSFNIPAFFTLHNFWLICPTLYLYYQNQVLCTGVDATGQNCSMCTRSLLPGQFFIERRNRLREKARRDLTRIWVSAPQIHQILVQQGYPCEQIEVLKLGNPRANQLWQAVGQRRMLFHGATVRFGFIGSLLPIKGLHILIQAVQYLQGDFEVHVYGEIHPEQLPRFQTLDVYHRIQFRGSFCAEEQAQVFQSLDVGIVPSSCHEQAGMVVEEFLAAGIPVLVSDRGGLSFYLQEGCGAVFPADQPQALAQAMQALIDNPEQIRRWQQNIRAPVSFDHYLQQMEERYSDALLAIHRDGFREILTFSDSDKNALAAGEKVWKCLMTLHQDQNWQTCLKSYLRHCQAANPVELVLLAPTGMLAESQDQLLAWCQAECLALEEGPRLLLLEQPGNPLELKALLSLITLVVAEPAETPLAYLARELQIMQVAPQLPPSAQAYPIPSVLQAWLKPLGWSVFRKHA